ncbi:phage tail tube protein [Devosia sp. SL43]|uniref:phage tail tube protein n=1 Tax=Devosia sp. SL43 TaxID=2806348 RepID=UPI001F1F081F|nr:phage tail tube protein [Devosia sp. SL43]UJW87961.1 histidine kinase [Devosia sp. SL43]
MVDTAAIIGYGTVFEMADEATPTVFVAMGEVINVDPGEDEDEEVEATHYTSPDRTREFIPGLTSPGSMTVEGNYIPGSATDLAMIAARGKKNRGRITLPNGVRKTFPIVRRGYNQAIPLDDRMTFTTTFKRAGATTTDAATAPVNGILPAIAGIAQVGETLTAHPGVWAPYATFTYQWKNEGANISGATSSTYEPVVGDIGDNITVTVTATNTGGSASATSAETTPVIAA